MKVCKIISESESPGQVGINNQLINYWNVSDIPKNTKEFVMQRDNYECQICKSKEKLHIHHKLKRTQGGSHDESNLITVCNSCHRHIELGDIDLAVEGCLKNALKHYNITNDQSYITFGYIYDELVKISKLLQIDDISNARYDLNIIIDKLENDLSIYRST